MKLLTENPRKLYFSFLISAIGSTLITNVYSTVDTVFIGKYGGPEAIAAVSCLNPFFPIMTAIGVLMGMGGAIMMNNQRGAGNKKTGDEFFTLSLCSTIIFSVIILLIFMFFRREMLIAFGAEGAILDYAMEYTAPLVWSSPAFTMCACLAMFVRNDGEIVIPTLATAIGGVINIIGDALFVFDWGLGLGVFGAGLATSIGQIVAFSIVLSYTFIKKCKLRFTIPRKIFNKLSTVFSLGISAFIIDFSFAVCIVVFNNTIMNTLSADHLAVYSAASTALLTTYCLFYSCGTALQPIVAANFGANDRRRVKKTLHIAIVATLTIAVIFTILLQLFPGFILSLFMDTTDNIMKIGPGIIRKYTLGVIPASLAILFSYYLQSVLEKTKSFTVSLLRCLLLPIVFVTTLSPINSDMIWYSVPLAELLTLFISFILIKEKKKPGAFEYDL